MVGSGVAGKGAGNSSSGGSDGAASGFHEWWEKLLKFYVLQRSHQGLVDPKMPDGWSTNAMKNIVTLSEKEGLHCHAILAPPTATPKQAEKAGGG